MTTKTKHNNGDIIMSANWDRSYGSHNTSFGKKWRHTTGEDPALAFKTSEGKFFYGSSEFKARLPFLEKNKIDLVLNASGEEFGITQDLWMPKVEVFVTQAPDWFPEGLRSTTRIPQTPRPDEVCLEWEDYGVPNYPMELWEIIFDKINRDKSNVLCVCQGGHGRTGTMLSILNCVMNGKHPIKSVLQIRKDYSPRAVETDAQVEYVIEVACQFNDGLDYKEVMKTWDGVLERRAAAQAKAAAKRKAEEEAKKGNKNSQKGKGANNTPKNQPAKIKPKLVVKKAKTDMEYDSVEEARESWGNVVHGFALDEVLNMGYIYDPQIQLVADNIVIEGKLDCSDKFPQDLITHRFAIEMEYRSFLEFAETYLADSENESNLDDWEKYTVAFLQNTDLLVDPWKITNSLFTADEMLKMVGTCDNDGMGIWSMPLQKDVNLALENKALFSDEMLFDLLDLCFTGEDCHKSIMLPSQDLATCEVTIMKGIK